MWNVSHIAAHTSYCLYSSHSHISLMFKMWLWNVFSHWSNLVIVGDILMLPRAWVHTFTMKRLGAGGGHVLKWPVSTIRHFCTEGFQYDGNAYGWPYRITHMIIMGIHMIVNQECILCRLVFFQSRMALRKGCFVISVHIMKGSLLLSSLGNKLQLRQK